MLAKKSTREFFEIFRTSGSKEKIYPEEKRFQEKHQDISIGATTVSPPKKEESDTKACLLPKGKDEAGNRIKDEKKTTEPTAAVEPRAFSERIKSLRKEEVNLKQETIIIGIIAATFLSLACFFVGHKVGYNKGLNEGLDGDATSINERIGVTRDEQARDRVKSVNIISKTDTPETIDIAGGKWDLWTLRIISYSNTGPNLQRATRLTKVIKDMTGHDAFVAKDGSELTVCVGRFKDAKGQGIMDLKAKIAEIVYENKKQFKGSYPVKLR